MGAFDKAKFFDACRRGVMGPTLDTGEVSGAERILDAMAGAPLADTAYALATAWHETAHEMLPIREMGSNRYLFRMYDPAGDRPSMAKKMGNVFPGDGVLFCGRGYVQLTWRSNYRRAGQKLGYPLEGNPDLAMRPDIAAAILREGMDDGWFTGKGFRDYLPAVGPANRAAFRSARRIINGMDKADLIAGYAEQFQQALIAGGWR